VEVKFTVDRFVIIKSQLLVLKLLFLWKFTLFLSANCKMRALEMVDAFISSNELDIVMERIKLIRDRRSDNLYGIVLRTTFIISFTFVNNVAGALYMIIYKCFVWAELIFLIAAIIHVKNRFVECILAPYERIKQQ
jgi:hypothetical protein